ncbi:MAG TPA: SCO family protein [Rhizomicrobium sp.]|jgi:protein SCO1/2|nr:SCO family protein [Rhizomicrobium sp.]
MIRTPTALVPYALMIAAVVAGLLWHVGDQTGRLGASVSSGKAEIGGTFALTDQDGKTRTDADFRGRFMLVYFGYSYCPDVCPTTLAMMSAALTKLGSRADQIVPVFVSIDPGRDKPAVLKTYLASFGPDFVGLTGTDKQTERVARAYHVYFAKHPLAGGNYAMDHSGVIYLMGPDGRFVTYYEDETGPDKLAADLEKRL